MDLLQRKAAYLYFQMLGEQVIKWYEQKPKNKELNHLMTCTSKLGVYINTLEQENDVNIKRLELMREKCLKLETELQELISINNN